MVLSMTGFGKAENSFRDGKLICEVKSLNNSRGFDVRVKLPPIFSQLELEIRQLAQDMALRGKLDLSVRVMGADDGSSTIDEDLFEKYYHKLSMLQGKLGFPPGDMVQAILRIPSVLSTGSDELLDQEVSQIKEAVTSALQMLQQYRKEEGQSLHSDLKARVESILSQLDRVEPHEEKRNKFFKDRLWSLLLDRMQNEEIDKNRFEQEVLFYLDKLDISEEKVRLKQHCNFFIEQLESKEIQKGRKLNFISQEMGREINTLGSKAQNSDIQHIVVGMKEDLEKIKEQIANTL